MAFATKNAADVLGAFLVICDYLLLRFAPLRAVRRCAGFRFAALRFFGAARRFAGLRFATRRFAGLRFATLRFAGFFAAFRFFAAIPSPPFLVIIVTRAKR